MNQHPAFWAWSVQDLKSNTKFVLLALADHAGSAWKAAWPSYDTLAEKTNLSRSTVIRCVKELTDSEYIIKEKRSNTSNRYHLNRENQSGTEDTIQSSKVGCHTDTMGCQPDTTAVSQGHSGSVTETPKPISNQSENQSKNQGVGFRGEETKAEEVELPEELNTDDFKAAWFSYEKYRREKKWDDIVPSSKQLKWTEMATWGHDQAIKAIKLAIGNGWRGIFEPKSSPSKPSAEGAPKAQEGSAKPLSTWEISKKIEAIEDRMKELLKRRAEVAGGDYVWDSPEIKSEYYELVAKKKQLNRELINL